MLRAPRAGRVRTTLALVFLAVLAALFAAQDRAEAHTAADDVAASMSGIPYVYGGSTYSGVDCSGYTQMVYAQLGIYLPRTSAEQAGVGYSVSEPIEGDLLVYSFSGYGVEHVGIYAGNGMMYDARMPGTVSGLVPVWYDYLIDIRRI
jgi:cell wall-associated NlpC family hydrolase